MTRNLITFTILTISFYHCYFVSTIHIPDIEAVKNTINDGASEEPDCVLIENLSRAAIADENTRWPNATVPFMIDDRFTKHQLSNIKKAMYDISERTCVKFVNRKEEEDYVYVLRDGHGCSSMVGKQGGVQFVNLPNLKHKKPCSAVLRSVTHELLHAVGLNHEMSRPDRDQYVTINSTNIQKQHEFNFEIPRSGQNTYNIPFDYMSIMMYTWNEFAIDRTKPTIIATMPGIGRNMRGEEMSQNDVALVNAMYKCDQK